MIHNIFIHKMYHNEYYTRLHMCSMLYPHIKTNQSLTEINHPN